MGLEGVHRPGREVDLSPSPPGLGLAQGVTTSLSHQGASHAQGPELKVRVVPTQSYSGSQCSWAAFAAPTLGRTRRVPQHPPKRRKAGDQSEVQYHCIKL